MRLLSVNIGQAQALAYAKSYGKTGIFKRPVAEPVQLTQYGLVGDTIIDSENHGGVDQAVYVYGAPDYAWWSGIVGHELQPGTFGENLTISDLESAQLAIGDYLHVGDVTLQVTSPRIPCVTLARRMDDPAFLKLFREAERPGVYCRVLRGGFLQAGEQVTLQLYDGDRIGVVESFRYFFAPSHDESTIRRYLAAPIAIRDRVDKEKQLEACLNS